MTRYVRRQYSDVHEKADPEYPPAFISGLSRETGFRCTSAGMMYSLHRQQVVGGELAEVFGFFKSPGNLEAITPPWLGFRVLHASDPEVREGTSIAYRLRMNGLPIRWVSRITEFRENAMFADEQLVGPYRYWYHRHLFSPVPGGVAVDDVVEYRLPLGLLGRVAHAAFVRRQLERIFDYRARVIAARFPSHRFREDQNALR